MLRLIDGIRYIIIDRLNTIFKCIHAFYIVYNRCIMIYFVIPNHIT